MKKNLLILFLLIAAITCGYSQTTYTYYFTGAPDSLVIPSCGDSIIIELRGAQGQDALVGGATGGLGGIVTGRLDVNTGDVIHIYVGGQNGYNGGGVGGINGNDQFSMPPIGTYGGAGGGASDIRIGGNNLVNRVAVAGGGGGAGHNGVWPGCQVAGPGGNGGAGGGTTGGSGTSGVGTPCNCQGGGGGTGLGGTQVAGGLHGSYAGNTACLRSSWTGGTDGSLGLGGNGATSYYNGSGGSGGGGGGYYGGGAGGNGSDTTPGGGGGGGSSYTGALADATSTQGTNSGNGLVIITIITSPPADPGTILGAGAHCVGDTISLSVNPMAHTDTYNWSLPSGTNILGNSDTNSIVAVVGNTSGYVYLYGSNVCGYDGTTDSVMLTANPLPMVSISGNDTICFGSSTMLHGNGADTYVWSTGGNLVDETVSPATNQTYSVIGTDLNGCTSSDFIDIVVNNLPVVLTSASDSSVCEGDPGITLTGSPSGGIWSGAGVSANSFNPTSAGSFHPVYSYMDAMGCSNSDSVSIIVHALPVVSANAGSTITCIGASPITLSGTPTGGVWSGPGVTGNTFTPSTNGSFDLIYSFTNVESCSNTDTITITVNDCSGIEELTTDAGSIIYPNPNNGNFSIKFNKNLLDVNVVISDIHGQIIWKLNYGNISSGFVSNIDLTEQSAGVYFIRIHSLTAKQVMKLIIR